MESEKIKDCLGKNDLLISTISISIIIITKYLEI